MLWNKDAKPQAPGDTGEQEKSVKEMLLLLSTKVERLEAKDQANSELRTVTNDRIQRLGEHIGEIRELFNVLSAEKKDLEVKLGQYYALVDQVNPAKIASSLREEDKKVLLLEGQVELLKKKQDSFTERFQTFEKKLNVFKGEDALLEIQAQVKEDMRTVKTLCMTASTHASQVENKFIKINERVNSLSSLVDDLTHLRADLLVLRDDLKAKQSTIESFRLDEKRLDEMERMLSRTVQVVEETVKRLDSRITNADIRLKLIERQKLGALANMLEEEEKSSEKSVEKIKQWLAKHTHAATPEEEKKQAP